VGEQFVDSPRDGGEVLADRLAAAVERGEQLLEILGERGSSLAKCEFDGPKGTIEGPGGRE